MQINPHFFNFVVDLSKLKPIFTIFNGNKVAKLFAQLISSKKSYAHLVPTITLILEKHNSQQFDLIKCKATSSRYQSSKCLINKTTKWQGILIPINHWWFTNRFLTFIFLGFLVAKWFPWFNHNLQRWKKMTLWKLNWFYFVNPKSMT
jgi:hypothetical protein